MANIIAYGENKLDIDYLNLLSKLGTMRELLHTSNKILECDFEYDNKQYLTFGEYKIRWYVKQTVFHFVVSMKDESVLVIQHSKAEYFSSYTNNCTIYNSGFVYNSYTKHKPISVIHDDYNKLTIDNFSEEYLFQLSTLYDNIPSYDIIQNILSLYDLFSERTVFYMVRPKTQKSLNLVVDYDMISLYISMVIKNVWNEYSSAFETMIKTREEYEYNRITKTMFGRI